MAEDLLGPAKLAPGGAAPPTFLRDLTADDLPLLSAPKDSKPRLLKRLKDTHHAIARLLAEGHKPAEVCAITGYSSSRISILQNDPAFRDLVEHYRANVELAYANTHERLATVTNMALAEITERLELQGEDDEEGKPIPAIPMSELLALAKMGADRSGFGKQTNNFHAHAHFDGQANRLNAARERVAALRRSGGQGPVTQGETLDLQALPAPAAA